MLRLPDVIFLRTSNPSLNDSNWSFKINSKSTPKGALSKHEIKIDLGRASGFAITSKGLCLIKGQQPESNKNDIMFDEFNFSSAGILCLIELSSLLVLIIISKIFLLSPLCIFSIIPDAGETNFILSLDLD